ncbi:hypothetical protein CRUP_023681, partial [Coryphaenoides rupestris]
ITYIETSAKDPPLNVDKAFHEQQVPEWSQKNKKKLKWRGERSTGSHRFHCVILAIPEEKQILQRDRELLSLLLRCSPGRFGSSVTLNPGNHMASTLLVRRAV